MANEKIEFEIVMNALDLSPKSDKGWVKQLNLVKWSDREPVWDIRSWHYPEGESAPDRMSKGVSLSKEEMSVLVNYTNNDDFSKGIQSCLKGDSNCRLKH